MKNPRGIRLRPFVALMASAALALTACTSNPEEDSPDGGAAASPTETTSTPAESTEAEPIDVGAADNLDPCTIVPRSTWINFIPKGDRDTVRTEPELTDYPLRATSLTDGFDGRSRPQYACVVTTGARDPRPVAAWGWFVGPFTPTMVNKMFAVLGGTEHHMGSYAAVTGGSFITAYSVGLRPPNTGFFVIVDAPVDTKMRQASRPSDDGTGEERVLTTRMLEVLDDISLNRDSQPRVRLPAGCPEANAAAITAVIGKVKYARGSNNGEGKQFCLYRNPERGQVLRLRGGTDTQAALQQVRDAADSEATKKFRFTASTGAEGSAVTGSAGDAIGTLVDLETLHYAFADVQPEFLEREAPAISRKALIELLEVFYAGEPGALTVE